MPTFPGPASESPNIVRRAQYSFNPQALPTVDAYGAFIAGDGGAPINSSAALLLDSVRTYRVGVVPPTGAAFTGTGRLLCYYWDVALQRWGRNSRLDFLMEATDGGLLNDTPVWFEDLACNLRTGALFYVPQGVGTTAQGEVKVMLLGWAGGA